MGKTHTLGAQFGYFRPVASGFERYTRGRARASWAFRENADMIIVKGLGDRIRGEEQVRKLPLARIFQQVRQRAAELTPRLGAHGMNMNFSSAPAIGQPATNSNARWRQLVSRCEK